MSLPETIWWCEEHLISGSSSGCTFSLGFLQLTFYGCRMVELRVADRDDLLIRREADGSWPDWVLVGLGWELDDSHDLSAVMDGVWRERPRAATEGVEEVEE